MEIIIATLLAVSAYLLANGSEFKITIKHVYDQPKPELTKVELDKEFEEEQESILNSVTNKMQDIMEVDNSWRTK